MLSVWSGETWIALPTWDVAALRRKVLSVCADNKQLGESFFTAPPAAKPPAFARLLPGEPQTYSEKDGTYGG